MNSKQNQELSFSKFLPKSELSLVRTPLTSFSKVPSNVQSNSHTLEQDKKKQVDIRQGSSKQYTPNKSDKSEIQSSQSRFPTTNYYKQSLKYTSNNDISSHYDRDDKSNNHHVDIKNEGYNFSSYSPSRTSQNFFFNFDESTSGKDQFSNTSASLSSPSKAKKIASDAMPQYLGSPNVKQLRESNKVVNSPKTAILSKILLEETEEQKKERIRRRRQKKQQRLNNTIPDEKNNTTNIESNGNGAQGGLDLNFSQKKSPTLNKSLGFVNESLSTQDIIQKYNDISTSEELPLSSRSPIVSNLFPKFDELDFLSDPEEFPELKDGTRLINAPSQSYLAALEKKEILQQKQDIIDQNLLSYSSNQPNQSSPLAKSTQSLSAVPKGNGIQPQRRENTNNNNTSKLGDRSSGLVQYSSNSKEKSATNANLDLLRQMKGLGLQFVPSPNHSKKEDFETMEKALDTTKLTKSDNQKYHRAQVDLKSLIQNQPVTEVEDENLNVNSIKVQDIHNESSTLKNQNLNGNTSPTKEILSSIQNQSPLFYTSNIQLDQAEPIDHFGSSDFEGDALQLIENLRTQIREQQDRADHFETLYEKIRDSLDIKESEYDEKSSEWKQLIESYKRRCQNLENEMENRILEDRVICMQKLEQILTERENESPRSTWNIMKTFMKYTSDTENESKAQLKAQLQREASLEFKNKLKEEVEQELREDYLKMEQMEKDIRIRMQASIEVKDRIIEELRSTIRVQNEKISNLELNIQNQVKANIAELSKKEVRDKILNSLAHYLIHCKENIENETSVFSSDSDWIPEIVLEIDSIISNLKWKIYKLKEELNASTLKSDSNSESIKTKTVLSPITTNHQSPIQKSNVNARESNNEVGSPSSVPPTLPFTPSLHVPPVPPTQSKLSPHSNSSEYLFNQQKAASELYHPPLNSSNGNLNNMSNMNTPSRITSENEIFLNQLLNQSSPTKLTSQSTISSPPNSQLSKSTSHLSILAGSNTLQSDSEFKDLPNIPPPPPSPLGVPLPPPVLGGFGGFGSPPLQKSKSLPDLPSFKPNVETKPVHLNIINSNNVQNTIWIKEKIAEKTGNVQLNFEELESLFENKKTDISNKGRQSNDKAVSTTLLDAQRHQNISMFLIGLKHKNIQPIDIVNNILHLDSKSLPLERLIQLKTYLPNQDEIAMQRSFDGDISTLDQPDLFFRELMSIPRLAERIDSWIFSRQFDELTSENAPKFNLILQASETLQNNEQWKILLTLILTVTNYLNSNNPRKVVHGFKMNSLPKLKLVKSVQNSKMNLLQYIIHVSEERYPDLENIDEILLPIITPVAKDIFYPGLASDLEKIENGMKNLSNEIVLASTSTSISFEADHFENTMKQFYHQASEKLEEIKSIHSQLIDSLKELAILYDEDMKDIITDPGSFFLIIYEFLNDWKRSKTNKK